MIDFGENPPSDLEDVTYLDGIDPHADIETLRSGGEITVRIVVCARCRRRWVRSVSELPEHNCVKFGLLAEEDV